MRRFKRVVSLVLTVVLLLSLSGPYTDMYPVLAETGNDLTGWTRADETKLSGNPADGWSIHNFTGGATQENALAYETDIAASKLQWSFDLSAFPTGCNFILGVGDKQEGFPDTGCHVLYFVFTKNSDASYVIELYKNETFVGKVDGAQEVDATVSHTYGFKEIGENGNWGFTMDGEVVDVKDAYKEFVSAMAADASEHTRISFLPNVLEQNLTIGSIHFSSTDDIKDDVPEIPEGWAPGNASTLTGDQESGWNLSFWGGGEPAYGADIDISKLRLNFDLSDTAPGNNFILGLGDRQNGFQDADANALYILFSRKEGNFLEMQYFKNQQWLHTETREIDLAADHTYGLMKINGTWKFAIDGKAAYGHEIFGTYIEEMAASSAGKTKVTFIPWGGVSNIKNLHFQEHADDLSAWNPGAPATITGNPQDGWRLSFWGLNYDGNTTSYDAAVDISKLRMDLDLSEATVDAEFVLGFGDQQTNFPSGGSNVLYFLVTKAGDTSLKLIYFNKDGVSFEEVTREVDLAGSHQYGFCKKDGKWVFAIDGEAALEGSQINAAVDALMRNSAGRTRVTFTPWNAGVNIRRVSFTAATDPDPNDLTGWTIGNTSTITGTFAEGWALGFYGASFPDNGSSYTSQVDVTQGKVRFNLAGLPMGKSIFLQLADVRGDYSVEGDTRLNFVLERKENGLYIYGFNNGVGYNEHMIEGFDFEKIHTLEFLQKNSQWLPALDGKILVKDPSLNGSYDSFVRALSETGQMTVTFVPNDGLDATETMVIKNIQIEGKDLITSGDLKGWTPGDTSTITGTPADGWRLEFHGASFPGNGSSYTAERKATLQKVKFNLSKLPVGKSIFLQLADARDNYSVEGDTRLNFVLERRENGLFFYGLNQAPYNDHMIEGFDFEKDHTFEFLQRNSQWLPALDGEILVKDPSLNEGYDQVVRALADTGHTVVTFVPNDGLDATESLVIQNINFEEKELVVSGDLKGWTPGLTSDLAGNPADGWRLGFYGPSFVNNGASYASELDVTRLKVHFNLSELADGKSIFLQTADAKGEFGNGADTRVNFVLEKPGDGSLIFYGFDVAGFGGLYNYHRIENFDFEADHVFEFLQRNGKWLPAIDGVIQAGDPAANDGYDAFTVGLSKAGKTTISFAPNDGLISRDLLVIKNIRFEEKPLVTSGDLTGWTPGVTSALTGNPKDGWRLDFTGLYFEANGSSYDADLDAARLQVNFNLADLLVGKSVILQLGSARGSFETGTPTRVNFVLERGANGKLIFYGMDTEGFGGLYNYHEIENFDFSKDHTFEFLLKNSRWQPAIDGLVLSGDKAANQGYDAFVKTMFQQLGKKTVVSFAPNSADDSVLTVKNIRFIQKDLVSLGDLTGWTPGETTTLTGTPANGWRIDFTGLYFVDNGTSYEAAIDASRLQMKFDLSELAPGKNVILQLAS